MSEFYYALSVLANNGCLDPDNAFGVPDDLWTSNIDTDWDCRWELDGPSAGIPLDGAQPVGVLARKSDVGGNGDPTVTIELWENGSLVTTLASDVVIGDSPISVGGSFLPGDVSDPSSLEIRVVCVAVTSGMQDGRRSVQVDAIEWEATFGDIAFEGQPSETIEIFALTVGNETTRSGDTVTGANVVASAFGSKGGAGDVAAQAVEVSVATDDTAVILIEREASDALGVITTEGISERYIEYLPEWWNGSEWVVEETWVADFETSLEPLDDAVAYDVRRIAYDDEDNLVPNFNDDGWSIPSTAKRVSANEISFEGANNDTAQYDFLQVNDQNYRVIFEWWVDEEWEGYRDGDPEDAVRFHQSTKYYDDDFNLTTNTSGHTGNGNATLENGGGQWYRRMWNPSTVGDPDPIRWVRWTLRAGSAHAPPNIRYRNPMVVRVDLGDFVEHGAEFWRVTNTEFSDSPPEPGLYLYQHRAVYADGSTGDWQLGEVYDQPSQGIDEFINFPEGEWDEATYDWTVATQDQWDHVGPYAEEFTVEFIDFVQIDKSSSDDIGVSLAEDFEFGLVQVSNSDELSVAIGTDFEFETVSVSGADQIAGQLSENGITHHFDKYEVVIDNFDRTMSLPDGTWFSSSNATFSDGYVVAVDSFSFPDGYFVVDQTGGEEDYTYALEESEVIAQFVTGGHDTGGGLAITYDIDGIEHEFGVAIINAETAYWDTGGWVNVTENVISFPSGAPDHLLRLRATGGWLYAELYVESDGFWQEFWRGQPGTSETKLLLAKSHLYVNGFGAFDHKIVSVNIQPVRSQDDLSVGIDSQFEFSTVTVNAADALAVSVGTDFDFEIVEVSAFDDINISLDEDFAFAPVAVSANDVVTFAFLEDFQFGVVGVVAADVAAVFISEEFHFGTTSVMGQDELDIAIGTVFDFETVETSASDDISLVLDEAFSFEPISLVAVDAIELALDEDFVFGIVDVISSDALDIAIDEAFEFGTVDVSSQDVITVTFDWPLYDHGVEYVEWGSLIFQSPGIVLKEDDHLYMEAGKDFQDNTESANFFTSDIDAFAYVGLLVDWENVGDGGYSTFSIGDVEGPLIEGPFERETVILPIPEQEDLGDLHLFAHGPSGRNDTSVSKLRVYRVILIGERQTFATVDVVNQDDISIGTDEQFADIKATLAATDDLHVAIGTAFDFETVHVQGVDELELSLSEEFQFTTVDVADVDVVDVGLTEAFEFGDVGVYASDEVTVAIGTLFEFETVIVHDQDEVGVNVVEVFDLLAHLQDEDIVSVEISDVSSFMVPATVDTQDEIDFSISDEVDFVSALFASSDVLDVATDEAFDFSTVEVHAQDDLTTSLEEQVAFSITLAAQDELTVAIGTIFDFETVEVEDADVVSVALDGVGAVHAQFEALDDISVSILETFEFDIVHVSASDEVSLSLDEAFAFTPVSVVDVDEVTVALTEEVDFDTVVVTASDELHIAVGTAFDFETVDVSASDEIAAGISELYELLVGTIDVDVVSISLVETGSFMVPATIDASDVLDVAVLDFSETPLAQRIVSDELIISLEETFAFATVDVTDFDSLSINISDEAEILSFVFDDDSISITVDEDIAFGPVGVSDVDAVIAAISDEASLVSFAADADLLGVELEEEFQFSTVEVWGADNLIVSIGHVFGFDAVDVSAVDELGIAIVDVSELAIVAHVTASDVLGVTIEDVHHLDDDPSEPFHGTDELVLSLIEESRIRPAFADVDAPGAGRRFVELPTEEILERKILPIEAQRGQSVYKVKLNAHNDEITKDFEYLESIYSDPGDVFYEKLLGPALAYRLDVGRKLMPTGSNIAQEVEEASQVLDSNLRASLADHMRRKDSFVKKVEHVFEEIKERDQYRNAIHILSKEGRAANKKGEHVMVRAEENGHEVDHWRRVEEAGEYRRESMLPSHSDLVDLDRDDAHSQYYLCSGDTVEGEIEFEDDVRIDGMHPSTHRHTGTDGTNQIHGDDVIDLVEDNVATDDTPPIPYNLQVLNFKESVQPPGVMVIDSAVSFKGHSRYQYEIQMTPLMPRDSREKLIFGVGPVIAGMESPPGRDGEFMHKADNE